jgi:plastocyanin
MRRLPPVLLALAVPLAVVACGDDDSGGAPEAGHVNVVDNEFNPSDIEVSAGDTVTWDFKGAAVHNVTFDDEHSDNMKKGSYDRTFDEAGSYEYRCTLHVGMEGAVTVS